MFVGHTAIALAAGTGHRLPVLARWPGSRWADGCWWPGLHGLIATASREAQPEREQQWGFEASETEYLWA